MKPSGLVTMAQSTPNASAAPESLELSPTMTVLSRGTSNLEKASCSGSGSGLWWSVSSHPTIVSGMSPIPQSAISSSIL